jgi:hypothetical protein
MTWVRLDDQWYDHAKIRRLPELCQLAWIKGITLSARDLTDGLLSEEDVVGLLRSRKASLEAARELVKVGLWVLVDGGYRIHDYHHYQPTAAQVKAQKEANRIRQNRYRNGVTNAVTYGVTNGGSNVSKDALVTPLARTGSGFGSGGGSEEDQNTIPESIDREPPPDESTYDLTWRMWRDLYEQSRRQYGRYVDAMIDDDRVIQRLAHKADDMTGADRERTTTLLRHWFTSYLRDDGDVNCQANARHPLRLIERRLPTYGEPKPPASATRLAKASPAEPKVDAAELRAAAERNLARLKAMTDGMGPKKAEGS